MRPKKRILLVSDAEMRLSILRFMLETRGYAVSGTISADEAMEISRSGRFDCAVVDLALQGIDGNALIELLKDASPDMPTVLLSEAVRGGERAHSADAFLGKGCCDRSALLDRVGVMCRKKRGPKKVSAPAGAMEALCG